MRAQENRLAILLQVLLGAGDQRDHTLVGFARALPERENAMLKKDEPFDCRIGLIHIRSLLRESKTRHDVFDQSDAAIIKLSADGCAIRLVDKAQDGIGMSVVDIFVRQKGMQQSLDRWSGRHRIEEIFALKPNHLLVAEIAARAQLAQAIEAQSGQSGRLDRRHVRPRAFDANCFHRFAEKINQSCLH